MPFAPIACSPRHLFSAAWFGWRFPGCDAMSLYLARIIFRAWKEERAERSNLLLLSFRYSTL